jgi:hypothetical protein
MRECERELLTGRQPFTDLTQVSRHVRSVPHRTSQTFLPCRFVPMILVPYEKNPKLIPQFIKLCAKGSTSLCEELLYVSKKNL